MSFPLKFIKPSAERFQVMLQAATTHYAAELLSAGECHDSVRAARHAAEEIKEILLKPDQYFYELKIAEQSVGFLWLTLKKSIKRQQSRTTAFLAYLYINPDFRRRGLAVQALRQYEHLAQNHFAAKMSELYVFKKNVAAIQLYCKQGYLVVAEEQFYQADKPQRYLMQKVLRD